jgi:hypothetical protein
MSKEEEKEVGMYHLSLFVFMSRSASHFCNNPAIDLLTLKITPLHSFLQLSVDTDDNTRGCLLIAHILDYTLNNPDTLTKYKSAAQISQKVLDAVTKLCVAGEKIVNICEQGDKLLEEEISKVYRGKKIAKGNYCPLEIGFSCPALLKSLVGSRA